MEPLEKKPSHYTICMYRYIFVNICNQGTFVFPKSFKEYAYSLKMIREDAYSLTFLGKYP